VNLLRPKKYYQPSLAQMKALIDNIGQHTCVRPSFADNHRGAAVETLETLPFLLTDLF
jgi:hypothetical protein